MRVQVRVQSTPDYKERAIFVRPQSVVLIEPLDPRTFDSGEPKSRLVIEGAYEYVALEAASSLHVRLERERVQWDEYERARQAKAPFGPTPAKGKAGAEKAGGAGTAAGPGPAAGAAAVPTPAGAG